MSNGELGTRRFNRSLTLLLIAALSLLSTACTTTPRQEVFRDDAPTMQEIYQGSGRSAEREGRKVGYGLGDQAGYTRAAGNEIHQLFPMLNNPRLVMYVFPHLTPGGLPVPGYSTAFPMFERAVLYALPGELPGQNQ